MEVNIFFSRTTVRRRWKNRAYALYHFDTHCQELFTKRHASTIKALIHEDMHQALHETVGQWISLHYDHIAPKLERWLV